MDNGEDRAAPRSLAGWLILLAMCAALVGWGVLNYALVPDRPREWDFGVLQDTPAQSIYSTQQPAPSVQAAPRQIPPLPEAKPRTAAGSRRQ